jgi:hypothetical protein
MYIYISHSKYGSVVTTFLYKYLWAADGNGTSFQWWTQTCKNGGTKLKTKIFEGTKLKKLKN